MQPKTYDVRSLALWAPRVAYAMVAGVPRVPFINDIPIQFSSSTVNAPPVVASFFNNLTQDTIIERVSYNLDQQNSFPGSPFQSLYFNQLKQSGATGVGIQMQVFGGPKYAINDVFTDLGNLADVFAVTWPGLVERGDVPLRDHQDVRRSLGTEIAERDDLAVLVDDGRRDLPRGDAAEDARR